MFRLSAAIVIALSVSSAGRAEMLMNIPALPPGDATLPGYHGWHTLDSMRFSIDRDPTEGGKGGTSDLNIGVGEIDGFHLMKSLGAGSLQLFQYAINGNSIGTVDLRVVTAGGKSTVPTAAWRLDHAFVASYSMNSSGGEPVEEFSLYFNKIAFAVVGIGKVTVQGWDFVTAKPWTNHGLEVDLMAELGVAQKALPGDFALNASVEGGDFLAWQRGESPRPLSAHDLSAWQANFGTVSTAAGTAVPEPTTWRLAFLGVMVVGCRRGGPRAASG